MASFRKSSSWCVLCLAFFLWRSAFVAGGGGRWSPLGATRGGTPRCVVRAEMRKEWHTPPEVVTSQIRDSASASEILERLGQERNNPGLNLINIGTSWEGLANFGHTVVREVEEDPMMDEFVDLTLRLLKQSLFENPTPYARACANMFWASAKLGKAGLLTQHLARVEDSLSEAVVATSRFMDQEAVAKVIWSCAELRLPEKTLKKVISSITYTLVDVADRLQARSVSTILVAAAKLGRRSPELLDQMPLIAEVLPELILHMEAQQVCNSIWAIAKLPKTQSTCLLPVIGSLTQQATEVIQNMNAQGIANIVWATAVLKNAAPKLLKFIPILIDHLIQSEDLVMDMGSQEVANCLWAAAKLQHLVPEIHKLIPVLGKRLEPTIPQMIDQAVSSTLLAIGQLPEHFQVLRSSVAPLARRMLSVLRGAPLREVSNACWGLAICRHADASRTIQQTWLSDVSTFFDILIIHLYNFNIFQPNR